MALWSPDAWLEAWDFAARAHHGQRLPGSELPYAMHVAAVAMEVGNAIAERALRGDPVARPNLAVTCALLHDVVEDTSVPLQELRERFGPAVADGVGALSKDPSVGDKAAQMQDSLERIRAQPPEVWMVKLADRINNLQAPPHYWTQAKIRGYRDEAREIHARLATACPVLGARLLHKIESYGRYAGEG